MNEISAMLTRTHKKVCLWGVPRSGSTFVLYNLIENARQESWNSNFNTTFNQWRKGSEPFRNNIEQKLQEFEEQEYWIAKVHSIDVRKLKETGVYKRFECMPDYNILLLRKNLFDTTLSFCIADIKEQWMSNDQDSVSIVVPIDKFHEMLEHQKNYKKIYNDMKFDCILYTEDLTDDFSNIWQFLTGEKFENNLQDKIFKSPDKTKVVKNYNELYKIYKETGEICQ